MPDSPAPPDARSEDAADPKDATSPFGDRRSTRFAADVEYRGRARGHDYLVRVRHRFLDSSFTVLLDGVEHDPKAEEKAHRAREEQEPDAERTEEGERDGSATEGAGASDDRTCEDGRPDDVREGDAGDAPDAVAPVAGVPDAPAPADDLQFRLEENFTVVHCTVRRPDEDGGLADAEVISVRTAGLGGAGEVDVRHGLERTLLVPADGSPSAARDQKRSAHPTRYALVAALTKAAGFLLPLLGFGALFSGLLDPVKEWIEERVRPVLDALATALEPVREWVAGVLRPIGEFLDALFAPVHEFLAALLRPVAEAWEWLREVLFGWIPDLSLPFSIPDWVFDVAVPVLVVLMVFTATFSGLRRRSEKLEATRTATDTAQGTAGEASEADDPAGEMAQETHRSSRSHESGDGAGESRDATREAADDDREGPPATSAECEGDADGTASPRAARP
ncbi:hypothetical protein [Brachybacterium sacelli]|uniref:Uncharacterized protein n=1 Tax=Brachybacterium sacelli TaxID=173364 RepID=A0ABS4WVP1_9MICO|nr:hypothetical protein [Brachybacterium sacelli]MBP2380269.1 hypothetical protein [Brachybacterium sacelli]